MINRNDVLKHINAVIEQENGMPVGMSSLFFDSGLDSLGFTFFILEMDAEYHILKDVTSGNEIEELNLNTSTVQEFVNLCIRSKLEADNENKPE